MALVGQKDAAGQMPHAAGEERHAALRKPAQQRRRDYRPFAFDYDGGYVFKRYLRLLFLFHDETPAPQRKARGVGYYHVTPAHAAAFLF